MSEPSTEEAPAERKGWAGAGYILLIVLLLSLVLGGVLTVRYTTFLAYVAHTLNSEESPPAWATNDLSVEQCVDEALQWAEECHGIKSLCDVYVSHVTELCLDSRDRMAYCEDLRGSSSLTKFGFEECQARGVQRHLNNEACSNAYRQIDTHCTRIFTAAERARLEAANP